ncbi:arylamine N-acetyltransferase [Olivibacter sp. SDN3]|uniref:arylamine N-acetyltransferase family protein n=1 Tax=Olivibacter sp. SDN3 TaxID=2764720 RepID=UPI001650EC7C|nr:arylamine N-acetyltransferase [Olivibacter sp. SDN3]QNL49201.1 arylamine N-acetyltransferase [Olivibacter sp. SDN3]
MMNVNAYLERIHHSGRTDVSLESLMAIHRLHPKHIPFENLDPLTGKNVSLAIEDVNKKLVYQRRGGYCFEQNLLLKEALTALGFEVTGLSGRVAWNIDASVITARTHMLLLVLLEEQQYVVDVGFGVMTLTAPLLLAPNVVQETPHGIFRIIKKEKIYLQQVLIEKEWRPVYYFDTEPTAPADYEVGNWYVSTHPNSHFRKQLIAAKVDDGVRYSLNDNVLTIRFLSGKKETQVLRSVEEVLQVLNGLFGIQTEGVDKLAVRLADINASLNRY